MTQNLQNGYNNLSTSEEQMSYSSSPKQSSSSQGSASEEYIKIVEQLIDSDDDELIMKRMAELQVSFPLLKKMTPTLTNQQKINIFIRDHIFRLRLTEKLKESNRLFYDPLIKVYLYTIRHRCPISQQFHQQDIQSTFQKFGSLQTLLFDKNLAYFRYDSYVSCYLAIKTLNEFEVSDVLRLSVGWCDHNDINIIHQHYAARCINDSSVVRKSMARFDIYLQVSSQFQLSKRIIGPKGNNMKKIIAEALQKSKIQQSPYDSRDSVAKLRLRGKGSGFYEGPNNAESDQMLNLCVSSKNNNVFKDLCEQCERLLFKISSDYKQYYYKLHNKYCQGIVYRKYELKKNSMELTKQLNLQQINSTLDFIDPALCKRKRVKEKEILRLITLRDKARKQGKFSQADDIRDHLSREGVMLIDSKHAGGKELKTTWKFI